MSSQRPRSSLRPRPWFAAGTLAVLASIAGPSPSAAGSPVAATDLICGGIVFDDRDGDGARHEALDLDRVLDDVEPGVAGVGVTIEDARGRTVRTTTGRDGRWEIDVADHTFPIRIDFEVPAGWVVGRAGPDAGRAVQSVPSPAACREVAIGGLGIHERGTYCDEQPEIAVACFVVAGVDDHDDEPAVVALSNAARDDEPEDVDEVDRWLDPAPRTLATVGELGSVFGLATADDGTVYAAGFTKRHARSSSDLNPDGNPTVVYRIGPDGHAEVLTFVDPDAADPHGAGLGDVDDRDLEAMDAVFTTGLGDLEISADERTLHVVDLGRRELVALSTSNGRIEERVRLDGDALGRTDCNVSAADPFGDLRAFGLGWSADETLLVGVVCTGASSADVDRPVREGGAPGPGHGDPRHLIAYVYEYADGGFTERLWWSLPDDRGETHGNGLISNDAVWHPWTPTYPFDDEHDVVSYPQPVVSDIVVDERGHLVVAVADRWSHQTVAATVAPGRDGRIRRIDETVAAGDIVRACRFRDGWTIEGTDACDGGFGNGWEFFDGDSYGWQAETALGSLLRLPGRDDVVATQMNPVTAGHAWRSGGLAWHDTRTGDRVKGARLYDGRAGEDGLTFETASGLGALAPLCGGPPPQIAGAVWHDVDADGVRDPADPAIPEVAIELRDEDGDVLAIDVTTVDGLYEFDDDNVPDGLVPGATYHVVMARENYDPDIGVLAGRGAFSGLVPTLADQGGRDDLDSDVRADIRSVAADDLPTIRVVAGDDPDTPAREPAIGTFHDFGLRDRYDLAVTTTMGDRSYEDGLISFRIAVANQGSVPSGAFRLRASLPAETSLISTTPLSDLDTSVEETSITWTFADHQSIAPGAVLGFEMTMRVNDPTLASVTNVVELVADSGDDADSTPGAGDPAEDDRDESTIELYGFGGRIWADPSSDARGDRADREPVPGVVVNVLDEADNVLGTTTTDDSGRFLFDSFPAGRYVVEVPPSEFVQGRPLQHYDRIDGAERAEDTVRVRSDAFELAGGDPVEIEIGFTGRPPRPLSSIVVPTVLMPLVALSAGWLVFDRRRRVGGVVGSH